MRPDNKRLNLAWTKHSELNREELRQVCRKIAEIEAIWRLDASCKSVADEALDFRRLKAA